MRRLMSLVAFWRRADSVDKRVTDLEQRGQLAIDRADAAADKAHRIALAEARVQREGVQYADRLNDRRTA